MTSNDFKKLKLPDSPGVYFFKKGQKTLYIGRATSLRDRVASYFKNDLVATRGQFLVDMVEQAGSIAWEETDSVLEAIILESNLIKKHKPKYNTKEKDDRSYNYVVITNEEFPRVVLVRGRVLEQASHSIREKFGPYPQGSLLREALVIIRKIFPFRDEKSGAIPGVSHTERFYQSIGLSPDVSAPDAKKEYAKTIRNITLFFEGRKKALVKALNTDMKSYAKVREFEKAENVKHKLYAINHIQDVALIKENMQTNVISSNGESIARNTIRIEAYDVAHLGGGSVVGVMTVVESDGTGNGVSNKNEYRKFKLNQENGKGNIGAKGGNDDVGGLREILSRRFGHPEWTMPDLIAVDGGIAQKNAAEKIVAETGLVIPVVSIVKDDRHRPRDILASTPVAKKLVTEHRAAILLANAEAHRFAIAYHRRTRGKKLLG